MGQSVVSLLGAGISGGFALTAVVITRRGSMRERALAADEVAMRYKTPLLHAAFDLQTRLYNIARQDFLTRFSGEKATCSQRQYAIDNTVYLVAQYLCYGEIIRRGMLFLDPVDRRRQRTLMEAMERVRDVFSNTMTISDPVLCLFRGEQRAVGEVMLTESDGAVPGLPRWDCMGYASFVARLGEPEVDRWFSSLRQSLETLAGGLQSHKERLIQLQHSLLELVILIDPNCEQVPSGLRERL
jgi:hypothetical protein